MPWPVRLSSHKRSCMYDTSLLFDRRFSLKYIRPKGVPTRFSHRIFCLYCRQTAGICHDLPVRPPRIANAMINDRLIPPRIDLLPSPSQSHDSHSEVSIADCTPDRCDQLVPRKPNTSTSFLPQPIRQRRDGNLTKLTVQSSFGRIGVDWQIPETQTLATSCCEARCSEPTRNFFNTVGNKLVTAKRDVRSLYSVLLC